MKVNYSGKLINTLLGFSVKAQNRERPPVYFSLLFLLTHEYWCQNLLPEKNTTMTTHHHLTGRNPLNNKHRQGERTLSVKVSISNIFQSGADMDFVETGTSVTLWSPLNKMNTGHLGRLVG